MHDKIFRPYVLVRRQLNWSPPNPACLCVVQYPTPIELMAFINNFFFLLFFFFWRNFARKGTPFPLTCRGEKQLITSTQTPDVCVHRIVQKRYLKYVVK